MRTPAHCEQVHSVNATASLASVPAVPIKQLLALTAAVLLAHVLLLTGTASLMKPAERNVNRPFSTRTVTLNAPAPAAVAPTTATVAAKPQRPRPAKSVNDSARESATADVQTTSNLGLPGTQLSNGSIAPVESTSVATASVVPAATEPVAATSPDSPASSPAAVAASAAAPPTQAAPPANAITYAIPGSKRLKYNVIGTKDALTYSARAEMLWLQDGTTYDARLEVSAFLIGARVRTSTGRLSADGLLPTRFADKFRTEVAAHFERDKGQVIFSANTPSAPLLPGLQDQLSVFIQLGAMLGGARDKYPEGTDVTFETIGPRSGETWVITVGGDEKLYMPGGQIDTIKLTRKPRRDYDQTAELWLAPSLGFLPARIKITDRNGDYVDQQWRATENP
jgi:hypothetical protein